MLYLVREVLCLEGLEVFLVEDGVSRLGMNRERVLTIVTVGIWMLVMTV